MLDKLPDAVVQLVVQNLRSFDYRQEDLWQASRVCRKLRRLTLRRVWEYFTITDVVVSGEVGAFSSIHPFLSRLLISDHDAITDAQWETALGVLEQMDWSHITMFSVELDAICRESRECADRILRFVHGRLGHVREQWVGLTRDFDLAGRFFNQDVSAVRELRVIGKPMEDPLDDLETPKDPPCLSLPAYSDLTVLYLDGTAASHTAIIEVARRSHLTLLDLNIDEFHLGISETLGLSGDRFKLEYPRLRRLAISHLECENANEMLIGSRLRSLASLYLSETEYPSYDGVNYASAMKGIRLMSDIWPSMRYLAVDGIPYNDAVWIGVRMPWLTFLSVGALGNDVPLRDECMPSVPVGLDVVGMLIDNCPRLVDMRIETPEQYEDMYNNIPGFASYYEKCFPEEIDGMPAFERPFEPSMLNVVTYPHSNLRHLTLNSWALSFDQLILLFDKLVALNSFEGSLRFTSRYPVTQTLSRPKHPVLAHLSLAHNTPSRYKHIFKTNLLKFVSILGALKTLDIYTNSDDGVSENR
ncbi:hypothetical protein GGF46_002188 [Coemansia sp. RSA 552]|nr:hypothetical protein GGF46_002188 [Coemansia sp. RSA 552]